jgi:mRNA deadenylase 3'-5' endonuclease subunit Ccr4
MIYIDKYQDSEKSLNLNDEKFEMDYSGQYKIKKYSYKENKTFYDELEQNAIKVNKIFKLRSAYEDYKLKYNSKSTTPDNKNTVEYFNYSKNKFILIYLNFEIPHYIKHHPDYTNNTNTFQGVIDYIFYSCNMTRTKVKKLPSKSDIDDNESSPNKKYPSDHLLILAQFKY